jgi:hypothetical protein
LFLKKLQVILERLLLIGQRIDQQFASSFIHRVGKELRSSVVDLSKGS